MKTATAPLSHLRKAEREDGRLDLARERQAHEAGARTRATAHERTPQQERQKAAREAERGREAWTLGQGMKKPVAGCYGRLTRWKGEGMLSTWLCCSEWVALRQRS